MIGVVLCGNANFFKFETITFGTIKEIKIKGGIICFKGKVGNYE